MEGEYTEGEPGVLGNEAATPSPYTPTDTAEGIRMQLQPLLQTPATSPQPHHPATPLSKVKKVKPGAGRRGAESRVHLPAFL